MIISGWLLWLQLWTKPPSQDLALASVDPQADLTEIERQMAGAARGDGELRAMRRSDALKTRMEALGCRATCACESPLDVPPATFASPLNRGTGQRVLSRP